MSEFPRPGGLLRETDVHAIDRQLSAGVFRLIDYKFALVSGRVTGI